MTNNAKMVDLPWVDGTTRTVPEGTVYMASSDIVLVARDGGYSHGSKPEATPGRWFYPHRKGSAAVRIFTEAPEPPVKVNVPTGLGAIVSSPVRPNNPGYVLTRDGWRSLEAHITFDPSEIALKLSRGARVLFEGVGEVAP